MHSVCFCSNTQKMFLEEKFPPFLRICAPWIRRWMDLAEKQQHFQGASSTISLPLSLLVFTSYATIFHICDGTDVQVDWRRSCTYGRAPNAIDISQGSWKCPSYTDTGPPFLYGDTYTPPNLVAFYDTLPSFIKIR